MSLQSVPNFRFLPASEEIALPFHVDSTGTTIGPNSSPGFNWRSPPNWDATIDYSPNDAVYYVNLGWQCLIGNLGTPPGQAITDSDGNILPDTDGNPIYPWTNIPPTVGSGSIATDLDPAIWARNHILAILLTSPGERVMRPTYGAGLLRYVFEYNDPFTEQTITNNIQMQLNMYEPNITIHQLLLVPLEPYHGIYQLEIQFSVGASPSVHTVSYSLGGTGIEITA